MNETRHNIIVYDGVCALCNRFVRFVLRFDKKEVFLFTSYQSEYAQALLFKDKSDASEPNTIYLYTPSGLYEKSTAVLRILVSLPRLWKLCYVFFVVPKVLRDYIYSLVAKNRYAIFGKNTCEIGTQENSKRILK